MGISSLVCKIAKNLDTVYLIGGTVRDLICGREPKKWTLFTDIDSLSEYIKSSDLNWKPCKDNIIDTYSCLGGYNYKNIYIRPFTKYYKGTIGTLYEDLAKRDFTVNTLVYDFKSKRIIDNYGGMTDLQSDILKFVPDNTQNKDRMNDAELALRAIRYIVQYDVKPSEETKERILRNPQKMRTINKNIISLEFYKVLTCGNNVTPIFLEYGDIITSLIPEIKPCYKFNQNNKYHKHDVYEHMLSVTDNCKTNDFNIKLAAFLHDIGKPFCMTTDEKGWSHYYSHPEKSTYLSVSILCNYFKENYGVLDSVTVLNLIKDHDIVLVNTKKNIKKYIDKYGLDFLNKLLILKQADMDDHIYPDDPKYIRSLDGIKDLINKVLNEPVEFTTKDLTITGNDVIEIIGIKEGKAVGATLNCIKEQVQNGYLTNDREVLLSKLQEIALSYKNLV